MVNLATIKSGEFYAEFDTDSDCWCVFHTESAHAYNCCVSKGEAEEIALEKNKELKKNA